MTACNTHVGPLSFLLGQPDWSMGVSPVTGMPPVSFGGYVPLPVASALNELVNNPDAVQTKGLATGVAVYVYDEQDVLAQVRGWWVLNGGDVRVGLASMLMAASLGADGAWTQVSVSGVYIGSDPEVVLTRSARPRSNVFGLTPVAVVADPSWDQATAGEAFVPVPAGGVAFAREYDSLPYAASAATSAQSMTLYGGTMTGGVDLLPPVVVPAPRHADANPPTWVVQRGADVRAYDRYEGAEVYGPRHVFRQGITTDILLTNGLLRLWPGPRGVPPYLNVQAFAGGAWRSVGCLGLAAADTEVLRGARLSRLTPEVGTLVLTSRAHGDVSVSLRRGARGIDVHHGADRPPFVTLDRVVRWLGMPPAKALTGTSNGTGRFGKGLSLTGMVQWPWPADQPKTRWAFSGWWLPTAASTSQGDSGLLDILDSAGLVGGVVYSAATKKITFALGTNSVVSTALTFSAGGAVFWSAKADSTNMTLVVLTSSSSTAFGPTPANFGTTDATYDSFAVGAVGSLFGSTTFGSGPFGGSLVTNGPNGVTDNLMLFSEGLTPNESFALGAATSPMAALPAPESRLIWYAPFDTTPVPAGSLLATGRRYETTAENGATRAPDDFGLTKGLAGLQTVGSVSPFGLSRTAPQVDVYAFLATTASYDDVADHHAQYAAASEQETRLR